MMNNLLEVKKLSVTIGGKALLQDISFAVTAGDSVAVAGPSGCGKSTLLRTLCLLTPPSGGEVFFAGKEFRSYLPPDLRRRIGYVPQKAVLFGKTVEEDLAYPFQIAKQKPDEGRMKKLLAAVGLAAAFFSAKTETLSGGEAQRVALVRSLLAQPQVLLLDESTSALDVAATAQVEALLQQLRCEEGLTLLWVSHQEAQVRRVASRVLGLRSGEAVFWDRVEKWPAGGVV